MTTFRSLRDQLIVERVENGHKSLGGIILPNNISTQQYHAKVLSVGPKVTDAKVGDVLVVNPFCGVPFTHENKDYIMIRENDVFGVVTDEPA